MLGLGCNHFGDHSDFETTRRILHHALDAGVNHVDTADVYGREGRSEALIGQVLHRSPSSAAP